MMQKLYYYRKPGSSIQKHSDPVAPGLSAAL